VKSNIRPDVHSKSASAILPGPIGGDSRRRPALPVDGNEAFRK
jgi:hypothetical protein